MLRTQWINNWSVLQDPLPIAWGLAKLLAAIRHGPFRHIGRQLWDGSLRMEPYKRPKGATCRIIGTSSQGRGTTGGHTRTQMALISSHCVSWPALPAFLNLDFNGISRLIVCHTLPWCPLEGGSRLFFCPSSISNDSLGWYSWRAPKQSDNSDELSVNISTCSALLNVILKCLMNCNFWDYIQ